MSARLIRSLGLLAGILAVAPAMGQVLPCLNPAADPCVIASGVTLPAGNYDIRPRSLDIKASRTITIGGSGTFQIQANNIVLEPGAKIVGSDPFGNITITLLADGSFTMLSAGTSTAKLNVSGGSGGGTINIGAGGNVVVNGNLSSSATNTDGIGGNITITSTGGNVSFSSALGEGIRTNGQSMGGGGTIGIVAVVGGITIDGPITSKGGDCGGCELDLTAGTDIMTTAKGDVNLTATVGDGGTLFAEAGGSITLNGSVIADAGPGSGTNVIGGAGGEVDLFADGGAITVNARTELNGSPPDGDGGAVDWEAHTTLTQNAPVVAQSTGFGSSDGFEFDSDADVTLNAECDLTADEFGGDFNVSAGGMATVAGNIHSFSTIDPVNEPNAQAGTFEIDACQINITSTGKMSCTGPGGDPFGSIFLDASTGMTIAGTLTATAQNWLTWRTSPPTIQPTAVITPAPTLVQDPTLPCCGVSCPTTTTTTTTTTTSTTVLVTTSTTIGGTTSTTAIATTSTTTIGTTSTTVIATTSTTSPASTSTSTTTTTTLATTTSLATTTTTTSTSTTAPSTTTSTSSPSTTTHPTTTASATSTTETTASTAPATTTTTMATTCLDTAVGLDAARCRLDVMSHDLGTADEADLGGAKLAKKLAAKVNKARTLLGPADPVKTKKLHAASKQVKTFATLLRHGMSTGKIRGAIAGELSSLATDVASEVASAI
jgi:hypothetical protein